MLKFAIDTLPYFIKFLTVDDNVFHVPVYLVGAGDINAIRGEGPGVWCGPSEDRGVAARNAPTQRRLVVQAGCRARTTPTTASPHVCPLHEQRTSQRYLEYFPRGAEFECGELFGDGKKQELTAQFLFKCNLAETLMALFKQGKCTLSSASSLRLLNKPYFICVVRLANLLNEMAKSNATIEQHLKSISPRSE